MNVELHILTENKVKLEEKKLKMEDKMMSLEFKNTELKKQLTQIKEEAEKLNGRSNGLQVEIEEKQKTTEKNLGFAMEKSKNLEKDIVKLKEELEKSLKWTKSSKLLSSATNQSNFNKKGLRCLNITPPFNPHSECEEQLSMLTLQEGGVSFGDGKKRYILGVGKVGKSLEESIDNVYHVDGLKYNLLSVSQICEKGNEVKFTSEKCAVVESRNEKKYILVIVDDYSRYTWTRFLRSKVETPEELVVFFIMTQTKLNQVIVGIRSDHGTVFENSILDQFCMDNGTSHNFSTPRTPQQNGVVKKKTEPW
ncbi:uncharacterized protein [Solanum lycopersicum]|uniref:uncharacterized protein n=1 Tax=Solanum lycopersicum TaxID=4081 RepID=UPI00374A100A